MVTDTLFLSVDMTSKDLAGPVLAALITAVLGLVTAWFTKLSESRGSYRQHRADVHEKFARDVHRVGHEIAEIWRKRTAGHAPDLPRDWVWTPDELRTFEQLDSVVASRLRQLEIVATWRSARAANELHGALTSIRNAVQMRDETPVWHLEDVRLKAADYRSTALDPFPCSCSNCRPEDAEQAAAAVDELDCATGRADEVGTTDGQSASGDDPESAKGDESLADRLRSAWAGLRGPSKAQPEAPWSQQLWDPYRKARRKFAKRARAAVVPRWWPTFLLVALLAASAAGIVWWFTTVSE